MNNTQKNWDHLFLWVLAFLYLDWGLLWHGNGMGVLLFALLFFLVLRLRLNRQELAPDKDSRLWLAAAGLSALQAVLFDATPVSWFNFMFLSLCAMYWLMAASGRRIVSALSVYFPVDMFCQMVRVPFLNFGRFFAAFFRRPAPPASSAVSLSASSDMPPLAFDATNVPHGTGTPARRSFFRSAMQVLFAIIVIFPLFLFVLRLLSSADDAFLVLVNDILSWFSRLFSGRILVYLLELLAAIPIAAYLYGALWGCSRPQSETKGWLSRSDVDRFLRTTHCTPYNMIYACLLLFIAAYLLFLGLQGARLLSALQTGLPHMTTYSQFAREGFFELCLVAAINLMLIAAAWLLCVRTQTGRETLSVRNGLRLLISLLSLLTLLLVVTAMTKMGLYIQAYGLTRLRIYTVWFMIWLFLVFAVIGTVQFLQLLRLRNPKVQNAKEQRVEVQSAEAHDTEVRSIEAHSAEMQSIGIPDADPAPASLRLLAAVSVAMFLLLGFANTDALIVRENISRAEQGLIPVENLDVCALSFLSDNALNALLDYYEEHQSPSAAPLTAIQQQITDDIREAAAHHCENLLYFQSEYDRDMMPPSLRWYGTNLQTLRSRQRILTLMQP